MNRSFKAQKANRCTINHAIVDVCPSQTETCFHTCEEERLTCTKDRSPSMADAGFRITVRRRLGDQAAAVLVRLYKPTDCDTPSHEATQPAAQVWLSACRLH